MRASELIVKLQQAITEHGDLPCVIEDTEFFGDYWFATSATKGDVRIVGDAHDGHVPVVVTPAIVIGYQ